MMIILPMRRIEVQYRNGMTIQRLARMYYVSYHCMHSRLKSHGLIRSYRIEDIRQKDISERYYHYHYKIKELADELKASCTTIIHIFRKCGLKRKKGGNRNPHISSMTPLKVHFLKKELGMTAEQISNQLHISKRYIFYILKLDTETLKNEFKERTK